MSLFFGFITSFLSQGIKYLHERGYSQELTNMIVLGITFLISLIWAVLRTQGVISMAMLEELGSIFGVSVATYEVIIKRLVKPAKDKVKQKLKE